MYDRKKIKRILWVVGAVVGLIILISAVWLIDQAKRSATLEVVVAPENATLLVNGKKFGNGTHRVEPGKYEMALTAEGFEPYYETIEIPSGKKAMFYHYLTGAEGNTSYYDAHPEEEFTLMTIENFYAKMREEEYVAQDPILKVTPYYDEEKSHYKINAEVGEKGQITVVVDLNTCTDSVVEKYKKEVEEYFKKNDIILNNYKVSYRTLCDEDGI